MLSLPKLELAVQELKAQTGVRIFNFSLNIEEHATTTGYSLPAQILVVSQFEC